MRKFEHTHQHMLVQFAYGSMNQTSLMRDDGSDMRDRPLRRASGRYTSSAAQSWTRLSLLTTEPKRCLTFSDSSMREETDVCSRCPAPRPIRRKAGLVMRCLCRQVSSRHCNRACTRETQAKIVDRNIAAQAIPLPAFTASILISNMVPRNGQNCWFSLPSSTSRDNR